jgi:hypothetical protein
MIAHSLRTEQPHGTEKNLAPLISKTDKSKTYTFGFGGKALTYEILV